MVASFSSGGSRLPPLQRAQSTTNYFLPTPTILRFLGWDDARLLPSDWSLVDNPFWTTFLFSLILFPCLFYGTWYLNPSLSKNRLGLSWVLGFYSALFFTIAGFYEVPHLRTVFNAKVDYQRSVSATATTTTTDLDLGLTLVAGAVAAAKEICYPILKAGTLAMLPNLPSFMRMDPSTSAKYYCFSDLETFQDVSSTVTVTKLSTTITAAGIGAGAGTGESGTSKRFGKFGSLLTHGTNFSRLRQQQHEHKNEHAHGHHSLIQFGRPISPQHEFYYQRTKAATKKHHQSTLSTAHKEHQQRQHQHQHHLVQQQWCWETYHLQQHHHQQKQQEPQPSLRHRIFQGQMQKPHLLFSLENYPDDARIGPHIIAANFQAFLVVDLILGAIHYRQQLEPFSTVIHHFIYFFIVVHMRAGDMLSVFCICGTPIEASSIFLAYGRMFPHLRTPIIERLYLACFVTTRLGYVSLLWHEIYYNYPDKSVAFLYTITIALHVYWFVLYIQTQRRFADKQRRQQLCTVLNAMAHALKEEFVASVVESAGISNVARGGVAKVEEKKGGEAHVKGHGRGEHAKEQDPLLDQLFRKRNEVEEEGDLLLPQPDTNVRRRRRSSPQV